MTEGTARGGTESKCHEMSWRNLDINKRYFGYVSYKANGNRTGDRTYVTIN